jgi:hypothetical protein
VETSAKVTANFVIYSAILGQDPPAGVTVDGAANGPETLQTKEQIVHMVEYLRLNGIVPPASVGQPPANTSAK